MPREDGNSPPVCGWSTPGGISPPHVSSPFRPTRFLRFLVLLRLSPRRADFFFPPGRPGRRASRRGRGGGRAKHGDGAGGVSSGGQEGRRSLGRSRSSPPDKRESLGPRPGLVTGLRCMLFFVSSLPLPSVRTVVGFSGFVLFSGRVFLFTLLLRSSFSLVLTGREERAIQHTQLS